MNKAALFLSLLLLLNTSDCDPQKQNQKISALESEVKQLKSEVEDIKQKQATPVHHYELRNQGLRTFRFDSATGETCIQLTTPADWKLKETKEESCGCVDATEHWDNMPQETDQQQKTAEFYYKYVVTHNCGPDPNK